MRNVASGLNVIVLLSTYRSSVHTDAAHGSKLEV